MIKRALTRVWIVAPLVGPALLSGAGAAASASSGTRVTFYSPFTNSGQPAHHVSATRSGLCGQGSLLVPHKDAWICGVGKTVYLACFSFKASSGSVLCLTKTGPWSALLKISLTRPLPVKFANKRTLSTSGMPWAVQTASGMKCLAETSATINAEGHLLEFRCPGSTQGLWGLSRKGRLWKVYEAPVRSTALPKQVGLTHAWF